MGWFRALGANRQVKDCFAALEVFDSDFEDEAAWDLLKPAIAEAIRRNEKLVSSKILRDGVSPRDIVLTLAANLSLKALKSGEHHTYRGMLSMTGNSYRVIFSSIVSLQGILGSISEEERNNALVNMADAIAEAG